MQANRFRDLMNQGIDASLMQRVNKLDTTEIPGTKPGYNPKERFHGRDYLATEDISGAKALRRS